MPRAKTKTNGEAATPESNGVGGNKMEAVRRALGALGNDAKPTRLHDHILREYKLDIQTNMISSYKSTILKGGAAPSGRKRGRKPHSETMTAGSGDVLQDLKMLKGMVSRVGAKRVRELLELLA